MSISFYLDEAISINNNLSEKMRSSPEILTLLVVIVFYCSVPLLKSSSALQQKDCKYEVVRINNLQSFHSFLKNFFWDVTLSEREFNECLRSKNGLKDITELIKIVEHQQTVQSVCEPEFIDRLLKFDHQIKVEHLKHGKVFGRKKRNRLLHFFRLFAGQVVVTCKQSLLEKLVIAENEDKQLVASISVIGDKITESEKLREEKQLAGYSEKLSKLPTILKLALKIQPRTLKRIENLVILDSIKPSSDIEFSVGVTLNNERALKEFILTKRACRIIDMYAQSTLYPITRLAWKGYMAKKNVVSAEAGENDLDILLEGSRKVQKWLKVVQHCQGVLMTKAYLDIQQEVPLELEEEAASDKQILTVDVRRLDEDQCKNESKPDEEAMDDDTCHMPKYHKFQQLRETFEEFDGQVSCYTFSKGLKGWLTRHYGKNEQMLAKLIRMRSYDESYTRSLINEDITESEQDVRFAGIIHKGGGHGGGAHAAASGHAHASGHGKGGHIAAHGANGGAHGHAHYYIFLGHSMPAAHVGMIIFAIITGSFLLLVALISFCAWKAE